MGRGEGREGTGNCPHGAGDGTGAPGKEGISWVSSDVPKSGFSSRCCLGSSFLAVTSGGAAFSLVAAWQGRRPAAG